MENELNKQPEGKKEIISQGELNNFIYDLRRYDKQHSSGTWLGRMISATVMQHLGNENDDGLQKIQDGINNNLTIDDIYSRHSGVLNKIGIDIESPDKDGTFAESETYASGELSINLSDKDLYLVFLRTLDSSNLSQETKELLEMIAKKLVRQVKEEYSLESLDDRLLELLAGLKDIVLEYERIGLVKEVSSLKQYQEYINTGFLKEYISAKNHKIFEPIGSGFNLSTFQRDSSYENYINYWQADFFSILEKIKKNPKATDFYSKVLDYGRACLDFAEEDVKQMRKKYKNPDSSYVDDIEMAIKDTRAKFESIL